MVCPETMGTCSAQSNLQTELAGFVVSARALHLLVHMQFGLRQAETNADL